MDPRKCPACIERAKAEKEGTAKRTNVEKFLDTTAAFEGKIGILKAILAGLKDYHDHKYVKTGDGVVCVRCNAIEEGLAL